MNKPRRSTLRAAVAATLMAALLTSAFAQDIDPRARALLEGLTPSTAPDEIHNMVLSISSTTYLDGQEFATTSRTIIDYDNERAAIVQEVMGMETRMLYVDGQMRMNVMGMNMPMPPGTEEQFASIFEKPTSTNMLDAAVRISFDGPVNYGDLLVGDQVSYEGEAGVYGTPDSPVMHYVFDASGALLGMHLPADGGAMLMVFNEPVSDAIMSYDMNVYMEEGGAWTLMQETALMEMEYNVELDDSEFQ